MTNKSVYLSTINGSYSFITHSDEHNKEYYKKFTEAIKTLCEGILDFVNINHDLIRRVKITPRIEIGGERKHLHAHILFVFEHDSKAFRLDYPKFRAKVISLIGGNPHINHRRVNARTYEQQIGDIDSYINKMTAGYNP